MKYFVAISIVLICTSFSSAQEIFIKAANSNGKAALFSLSGEKSLFIDSISLSDKGTYQYNLQNNHSGFYRLIFNSKKWLDFVYEQEDVQIETEVNHPIDSLKIIESNANKIYNNFIKLNKDYKTKSELLFLILNNYPDNNAYLQTTKETLLKLQEEYLYFINITAQSNPGSFISKYVLSAQLPITDSSLKGKDQLNYLKSFALDNVNFSDDVLIFSDAFTNKTIEYLSY